MKNIPRISRINIYKLRENEEGSREDKLNDIEDVDELEDEIFKNEITLFKTARKNIDSPFGAH